MAKYFVIAPENRLRWGNGDAQSMTTSQVTTWRTQSEGAKQHRAPEFYLYGTSENRLAIVTNPIIVPLGWGQEPSAQMDMFPVLMRVMGPCVCMSNSAYT